MYIRARGRSVILAQVARAEYHNVSWERNKTGRDVYYYIRVSMGSYIETCVRFGRRLYWNACFFRVTVYDNNNIRRRRRASRALLRYNTASTSCRGHPLAKTAALLRPSARPPSTCLRSYEYNDNIMILLIYRITLSVAWPTVIFQRQGWALARCSSYLEKCSFRPRHCTAHYMSR